MTDVSTTCAEAIFRVKSLDSKHRLSKRQSLTTVFLRTPITHMIFFNQGILLLGSNHFLIVVSLLSIRVVDLIYACFFFFFNLLLGLLGESLFMVTEKTRSLFVVY